MFSPTSFPAAAWRVTKALNVVPVTITQKHCGYTSYFQSSDNAAFHACELFLARESAVAEAVELLAEDEARVARAIARHARRRAMVRKVLAGGAK